MWVPLCLEGILLLKVVLSWQHVGTSLFGTYFTLNFFLNLSNYLIISNVSHINLQCFLYQFLCRNIVSSVSGSLPVKYQ